MQFYLGCLVFGGMFAIVSVVLGDILSTALDGILDFMSADYLNPTVLASAITVLGGVGLTLTLYSDLTWIPILVAGLLAGALIGVGVHFFYVRPMKAGENSSGYSMASLIGKLGEVLTPIPAGGYGEVMIRTGASNTNQIAASFEDVDIQAGDRVVVIEVREGTVFVSRFENINKGD